MKPQLGRSQLAILKHAPSVHRKYRPSGSMGTHTQAQLNDQSTSSSSSSVTAVVRGGAVAQGSIGVSRTGAPGFKPPSLLRRSTSRHKSYMELDLPSLRALRREPSMMELDPPSTLFAPAPTTSNFLPGPWAFFQAAEAQREQRQAQVEFLAKLQELRLRDEQLFVNVMKSFAKEYPVQFGQLTEFMKQMESELEQGIRDQNQEQQQQHQHQQQQQLQYRQQLYQQDPMSWLKEMMTSDGNQFGANVGGGAIGRAGRDDYRGTKSGVLALAQAFGNQIYGSPGIPPPQQLFLQQQEEQQRQLQFQYMKQAGLTPRNVRYHQNQRGGHNNNNNHHNSNNGRGGRGGRGRGGHHQNHHSGQNGGGGGGGGARPLLILKRGKSYQQQQQAMQQMTAYQRQLHQQVQNSQGLGHNGATSPVPMAHELMQYVAMAAMTEQQQSPPVGTPQLGPASPNSSNGSLSPLSPLGFGANNSFSQFSRGIPPTNQAGLELAAMNMQLNLNSQGSSRRSRYKPPPPPLRIH
ncbi:hypothetical protein BG004_005638 [Podila humilis]|nr:hypothetical protein BG004_005638 [Podila humilis]